MELFRAIRIVETKDSQNFRQFVFENLKERNFAMKIANRVYFVLPHFFLRPYYIIFYGLYSFFKFKIPSQFHNDKHKTLGIYAYKNELRQLNFIKEVSNKNFFVTKDSFQLPSFKMLFKGLSLLFNRRIYSICYRINKKHNNFLVSSRTISTLFYYLKSHYELTNAISNIIVSSDTNPYAIGPTLYAQKIGINTIYINHGHIPECPPRLFFDFSLIDGPALLATYERTGKTKGQVLFKGVEGASKSLTILEKDQYKRVGVFLSLVTNWEGVYNLIEQLTKLNLYIKIRLHPNLIIREKNKVRKYKSQSNIEVSYANKVASTDLDDLDFVIAGNSSVHLTALKYGIPTAHYEQMDLVPDDFYLFKKLGLVYEIQSLQDFNISHLINFYNQLDWIDKYTYFDPVESRYLSENINQIFK